MDVKTNDAILNLKKLRKRNRTKNKGTLLIKRKSLISRVYFY